MPTPPLALPVIVDAISMPAVTSAENTSSSLVPAVTGMDKPSVIPLLVVPIATRPVSGGASVTEAPGTAVKILFGVVELKS
ncbi:hypothetical protein D3C73_1488180 [compost metagenome]